MNVNDIDLYDGYPTQEMIARGHMAAIEREKREHEENVKCLRLELEQLMQHQPNDFAD